MKKKMLRENQSLENVAKWLPSATTPWTLTLLAIHSFRFTYDIPAKKNQ